MLNTEIKNAVVAYSVMKRDLHTLVEGSKSPLDYIGEIEEHPHIVSFIYPIEEERQNSEVYHALVSIGILIENMLKEEKPVVTYLINNAGIARMGACSDFAIKEVEEIISVNCRKLVFRNKNICRQNYLAALFFWLQRCNNDFLFLGV